MDFYALSGTLRCHPSQSAEITAHLPAHIAATRAEPGCLVFEVTLVGPCQWRVYEIFADLAAFEAHQTRAAMTGWASASAGAPRDFTHGPATLRFTTEQGGEWLYTLWIGSDRLARLRHDGAGLMRVSGPERLMSAPFDSKILAAFEAWHSSADDD